MITCCTVHGYLDDFQEGCLPQEQRLVIEQHLAVCGACRCYYKTYVKSLELVRKCTEDQPLPCCPEILVDAILAARRQGKALPPCDGPDEDPAKATV